MTSITIPENSPAYHYPNEHERQSASGNPRFMSACLTVWSLSKSLVEATIPGVTPQTISKIVFYETSQAHGYRLACTPCSTFSHIFYRHENGFLTVDIIESILPPEGRGYTDGASTIHYAGIRCKGWNGTALEIISKVLLRHQNLKTRQFYLGKVSEAQAIRWMDILHGT